MDELVFDVETKEQFSNVGRNSDQLGVSVLGIYSYRTGRYDCFEEHELGRFFEMAQNAGRIIGYNIKHFDYAVLQPYSPGMRLRALPTLDLMEEATKVLGFRPRLNDLAKATLGVSKSGSGLEAIRWFREGKMEQLQSYCIDDVKLTKELYEYGKRYGFLKIERGIARQIEQFPVYWKDLERKDERQVSLFG